MSSIALSGNASGAGVFTIASPNSASSYTITLPTITGGNFIVSDASGNVGIGTTSPSQKLQVTGNTISSNFYIGTGTANAGTFGADSAGTGASITMYGSTGANPGAMLLSAGSAERMRIDNSGNVMVGTTSVAASAKVTVSFAGGVSTSRGIVMVSGSTASTAMIGFQNPNGYPQGEIITSGTTTAYGTSSDYRLKEDIAPMTGALAKVAALKPVTYKWKVDGSSGEGFIAHELAEVCPYAVIGEKDAVDADGNPQYQGIDVSFLVATLTAAIQEQQAIITSLTARIAALEGQTP